MERLVSCVGLIVMMALAWLMSSNRRRFPWRVAILGLLLQISFAVLVLRTAPGRAFFEYARQAFLALTSCAQTGTQFVLGAAMMEQDFIKQSFAVQVLPVIIFFSTLMSVLYYLGIIQRVIGAVALVMRWTLGTSGTETLAAAANIFVGQSEAPLVVRPYLHQMTQSELMALMVVGFATVSGSVLAAYSAMGIDPGHLLTASVISAPAALAIAKIMQPEVERPIAADVVQAEVTTVLGIGCVGEPAYRLGR
jgi:CNT family concentrative nucleoside transporter